MTVAFYLIAQMVGAGKLIQLLFGLPYMYAVISVGVLMIIYVTFGGMVATTWVQIIKACLLLAGATFMAFMVLVNFGFSPEALFAKAVEVHPKHLAIMAPGTLVTDPISAISLGLALMFGTAGLPHILMRFFTVADAKAARKSVFYATGFIGYFYILTFIIGFGAIVLVSTNPEFLSDARQGSGGHSRRLEHGGDPSRGRGRRRLVPGLHLGGGLRHDPRGRVRSDAGGRLGDQPRPLRHRDQGRQRQRAGRNPGLEDRDRRSRRHRDRARHRLREAERRLHGRSCLLDRGFVQLPGPAHVDVCGGA